MREEYEFEIRDPRSETRDSRSEVRDPRLETRDPRLEIRDPRSEIRDPRLEIRDSRIETRDSRFEIRGVEALPVTIATFDLELLMFFRSVPMICNFHIFPHVPGQIFPESV